MSDLKLEIKKKPSFNVTNFYHSISGYCSTSDWGINSTWKMTFLFSSQAILQTKSEEISRLVPGHTCAACRPHYHEMRHKEVKQLAQGCAVNTKIRVQMEKAL